MEYTNSFELDFIQRTLSIMDEYKGEYDATLLMNCLLGLLILPRERLFDNIQNKPLSECSKPISDLGTCLNNRCDLKELIRYLRNAVAHFNVKPMSEGHVVVAFSFKSNGLRALIPLTLLREFVMELASHLITHSNVNSVITHT